MVKKKTAKKKVRETKKSVSVRFTPAELEYLDELAKLASIHTGVHTTRTWVLSRVIVIGGRIMEKDFT